MSVKFQGSGLLGSFVGLVFEVGDMVLDRSLAFFCVSFVHV